MWQFKYEDERLKTLLSTYIFLYVYTVELPLYTVGKTITWDCLSPNSINWRNEASYKFPIFFFTISLKNFIVNDRDWLAIVYEKKNLEYPKCSQNLAEKFAKLAAIVQSFSTSIIIPILYKLAHWERFKGYYFILKYFIGL